MATGAEIQLRTGDHVIQPSTDYAEGHGDRGDVDHGARRAADGTPAALTDRGRYADTDQHHDGVPVQHQWSEIQVRTGRAAKCGQGHGISPLALAHRARVHRGASHVLGHHRAH